MTQLILFLKGNTKHQEITIEGWIEIESTSIYQCTSEEGFDQPDLINSPESIKRHELLKYYSCMGRWFYGAQEVTKFQFVEEEVTPSQDKQSKLVQQSCDSCGRILTAQFHCNVCDNDE